MQDKALQSEKMQDNPAKSRTVGNSAVYVFRPNEPTSLEWNLEL